MAQVETRTQQKRAKEEEGEMSQADRELREKCGSNVCRVARRKLLTVS